jgi:hypothetical protein
LNGDIKLVGVWGGRRRNAGRKMGSKNRIPRPRKDADRLRAIVSEIEQADFLISDHATKEFKGSSFEFLQAVMRAEQLPIKVRLYAAKEVIGYEPHIAEGQLLDAVFNNSTIMAELTAHACMSASEPHLGNRCCDKSATRPKTSSKFNIFRLGSQMPIPHHMPRERLTT